MEIEIAPSHRALAAQVREAAAALSETGDPRGIIPLLVEMGAFDQLVPEAFGGACAAVEPAALCVIRAELAFRSPAADAIFAAHALGSHPLIHHAEERLQQTLLPRAVRGAAIFAWALAGDATGPAPDAPAAMGQRDGDGYVLSGQASRVLGAPVATHFTVPVRTGDGSNDLSAFVVPADAPGLRVASPAQPCGTLPVGDVVFEGVRVPISHRLGAEGEGAAITQATRARFRSTFAAAAVGLAARAEQAIAEAARAGNPRAEELLAACSAELDAARLLVQRAALAEQRDGAEASYAAAVARFFAFDVAQHLLERQLGLVPGAEPLLDELRMLRHDEDLPELKRTIVAPMLKRGA